MSFDVKRLMPLVNSAYWDDFILYMDEKRIATYDALEKCDAERLKFHQGQLALIKDLLTLHKNIQNIKSADTKTQFREP